MSERDLDRFEVEAIKRLIEEIQYDDELRERFNKILADTEYFIPEPKEKKVEKKLEEKMKKYDEEKEEMKIKLQALENEKKLQRAYEIMDKYGIPRSKIVEVEQFAKEKGITKWETACKLYAKEQEELQSMIVNKPPIEREKDLISRYSGAEGKTKLKEDLLQIYKNMII